MSFFKPTNDCTPVDLLEYRQSLYYNKFTYKLRFESPGLRCVRYPTITFHSYKQRIRRSVWGAHTLQLMEQNFDNNVKIAQIVQIHKASKELRARHEYDTVSFFSSDLSKLIDIRNHLGISGEIYEAKPVLETGVLYFVKEPKHKFRAVFGWNYNNTEEMREQLCNFIETYGEYIEPSNKIKNYAYNKIRYSSLGGSSFDFTNEKILTIVALSFGDCVERIYELKKRPTS